MAPKVVAFVDYQNVHFSALNMFAPLGARPEDFLIDPLKLAQLVVDRRAPGGELHQVRVYRGRPNPRKEPRLTSATDRQAMSWATGHGVVPQVIMKRRALWYPHDFGEPTCYEKPREKGIDVSLAIDVVRMAIGKEYEVGIIFSRDTDLLPAIETVFEFKAAHVEVATWEGNTRLRLKLPTGKQLWCHTLDEDDFHAVLDYRPY